MMMRDPRYWTPSHPDHQRWVSKVSDAFLAHYPDSLTRDTTGRQIKAHSTVHVRKHTRRLNEKIIDVSEYDRSPPTGVARTSENKPETSDAIPEYPPGTDVQDNINEAKKYSGYTIAGDLWLYSKVRNGASWDYKKFGRKYEPFGNFHYGIIGAAMGYSLDTLLRMAGWAQIRAGTSQKDGFGVSPGLIDSFRGVGGEAPFGDDPGDQVYIINGYKFYNFYYGGENDSK